MTRLIFLFILSFMISSPTQASPGLEEAFSELNYALTVEWDQKNEEFYHQSNEKFANALIALRVQGLTNEDFKKFISKKLKERGFALDVDQLFNSISFSKMPSLQVEQILTEAMKKSYSQGTSWGPMVGSMRLMVASLGMVMIVTAVCGEEDCE